MSTRSVQLSLDMLLAVVNGDTYDAIAARSGMTRSAVEFRVKSIAQKLLRDVGVDGLTIDSVHSIRRLRAHQEAIIAAVSEFEPRFNGRTTSSELNDDEIRMAVSRVRLRSRSPARDVALFFTLLCTAARPIEIARLTIRDYLTVDGAVRHESTLRAEIAVNHVERPLFFSSRKATVALDDYLLERKRHGLMVSGVPAYRGLLPESSLFLKQNGMPYTVAEAGDGEHVRLHCREILDNYRKIFRYIGIPGLTALTLRRTVAMRLYSRGASEDQIGDLFGISDLKGVRERFPRPVRPLTQLVCDLI